MTKRPPIASLRLPLSASSASKLGWAAYIIALLGLVVVFAIVSYRSAQERSIGWEHVSGDLYRRTDCTTKQFVYRESGGFGNVAIETVEMDEEQIEVFCGGGSK